MTKYIPDMNDHWKLRCIAATRGNQSFLGAVVLAIIGHVPNKRPYYKGLAEISRDGVIWAKFYPRGWLLPRKAPVCSVQDFTDELRRLADTCHMNDREVGELFSEAKKWIERDHRAQSFLH